MSGLADAAATSLVCRQVLSRAHERSACVGCGVTMAVLDPGSGWTEIETDMRGDATGTLRLARLELWSLGALHALRVDVVGRTAEARSPAPAPPTGCARVLCGVTRASTCDSSNVCSACSACSEQATPWRFRARCMRWVSHQVGR